MQFVPTLPIMQFFRWRVEHSLVIVEANYTLQAATMFDCWCWVSAGSFYRHFISRTWWHDPVLEAHLIDNEITCNYEILRVPHMQLLQIPRRGFFSKDEVLRMAALHFRQQDPTPASGKDVQAMTRASTPWYTHIKLFSWEQEARKHQHRLGRVHQQP
jgi:hypothetical protein